MSSDPRKRSRFDQTEPEPSRRSRFDRRSRSPVASPSQNRRSRSPAGAVKSPSASGTPKLDPAAAAAAAAARINAQLQAKKGIQHVDVPPIRAVSALKQYLKFATDEATDFYSRNTTWSGIRYHRRGLPAGWRLHQGHRSQRSAKPLHANKRRNSKDGKSLVLYPGAYSRCDHVKAADHSRVNCCGDEKLTLNALA